MPQEAIKKEPASLKVRERKQFKLPSGYGDNKIVLLARDPWWIFAYWEILKDKKEAVIEKIRSSGDSPKKSCLRVVEHK